MPPADSSAEECRNPKETDFMKSFGITDKGKVRKENQDSYIIENCDRRNSAVIAICDGMGGAKAGDLASQLACKAFVSGVYEALISPKFYTENIEKILKASCADANGVVYEYSGFDPNYNGMGTTLVGGVISKRKAHLVNVGDSRAYLISDSGIKQITRDHSYVNELIAMGAIKPEEAPNHPNKNVITRALGVDRKVEADYFSTDLRRGDCILLCSDGLSNMVTDEEIFAVFKANHKPEHICRTLLGMTLDRGAKDNVSVVAVLI